MKVLRQSNISDACLQWTINNIRCFSFTGNLAFGYIRSRIYGAAYNLNDLPALATDGNFSTCAASAMDVYDGNQQFKIELAEIHTIESLIIHVPVAMKAG